MNDETKRFALQNKGGAGLPAPVLHGVQAEGRLDGPLFELSLRQTYRNESDWPLEVIYTFPLPAQAVLLGFASELNGARQVGSVAAKRAAEASYEAALAEGDAPVMVEALGDGLYTANIGNLAPGDELVLEVRYAQLQPFEQARLRLAIPTTIAPRYGNAGSAGLQPQQVPATSILAEYPLALAITLVGLRADAQVESPTHRFDRAAVEDGLRLELEPGAWLDRDVVVLVAPRELQPSLVIQAADPISREAPVVVLAALRVPPVPLRPCVALKLLVDCSGSMGGDSIASARQALQGVLAELGEHDRLSLSCFGSTVQHLCPPTACTPAALQELRPMIDRIDATLGGTEMENALHAVFQQPTEGGGADVLMVTDGEVWQIDSIIARARASRHRVFIIGVGTSPAEGPLRRLAQATGGACEFATPGEALAQAAARMLGRIRQQAPRRPRVDWGEAAAWQVPLGSVFGGDTVLAWAGLRAATAIPAVRLLADDPAGAEIELARGEASAPGRGDTLARVAAARRLPELAEGERQAFAVDYQLLSPETNCILVHERAAADKTQELARLHQVAAMSPAGWGAAGSVAGDAFVARGMYGASPMLTTGRVAAASIDALASEFQAVRPMMVAPPRLLAISSDFDAMPPAAPTPMPTLDDLARCVLAQLAWPPGSGAEGIATICGALPLHTDVRLAIERVVALGIDADFAWLLLAHWILTRHGATLAPAAAEALQPQVALIDASQAAKAAVIYRRLLGAYPNDEWVLSRIRRLQKALSGG